jgi:Flp pilus assembly protein TadG
MTRIKSRAVHDLFRRARRHPRGVAAVLVAFLLPLFVGFVALSADTAVIATARSQLSTAADAAALAAAQQLASARRVSLPTDLTPEYTAGSTKATAFAAANSVLGQPVVVTGNPSNASGVGDVSFGYVNPSVSGSSFTTNSAYTSLFNSAQVTAQRSASHTGVVPTFFSSLMGFHGTTVTVTSTATAQPYQIKGFQTYNSLNANLLPIVLDNVTYNLMITNDPSMTDQYGYDPTTNTVTNGADGIHESKLYPVASGSPGNWGTINVGVSNNSTSVLSAQIEYGITPAQLATYPGGVIQLDQTLTPPSITFSGNPGISAGIKSALDSIIGKPVTIPIYDTNGGNGNNAWYRVIAFAGVRILSVNFQGNPKYVIVQPALVTDQTAIAGSASSWTQGGLVVLHLTK